MTKRLKKQGQKYCRYELMKVYITYILPTISLACTYNHVTK
jgi:hypothetical protein